MVKLKLKLKVLGLILAAIAAGFCIAKAAEATADAIVDRLNTEGYFAHCDAMPDECDDSDRLQE